MRSSGKKRMAWASMFALLVANTLATAALVDPPIQRPIITYQRAQGVSYNASTQSFAVNADAAAVAFPDNTVRLVVAPQSVQVRILVDSSGNAASTGTGETDLVVEGQVDKDGNGSYEYSGVLLTGRLAAFGYEDGSSTTDYFDFVFDVTGGQMAPLWADGQIGMIVTSEGSTFGGTFTADFGGGAKGNIGWVPCVPTSLTGHVLCQPGATPVEGALVEVFGTSGKVGEAATAADGSYTVADLAAGEYTVTVSAPQGYKSCDDAQKTVLIPCNRDGVVDFCVCPCAPSSIKGQILCGSQGIKGISVSVKDKDTGNEIASAITDDNGQYTATPALEIGSYTVSITVPDGYELCGPDTQDVTLECEQDGIADFCLCPCPPSAIIGTVVCNEVDGSTTPQANISVTAYDSANQVAGSALTAADGSYSIPGLAPGTYTVTVTVPDKYLSCDVTSQEVTLPCGQNGTADFCVCPPTPSPCETKITGKVKCWYTYKYTPVAGATITVTDAGGEVVAVVSTGDDGRYTVEGLEEGSYTVKLTLPDGYVACSHTSKSVTLACDQPKSIDFCACPCPPGKIVGTIKCDKTCKPVSGVTVKVLDKSNNVVASAVSGSDGKYVIADLPAGTYTVKVMVPAGYQTCCQSTTQCIKLTCGDTDTVDFCLCPPCEKGKVVGKVKCSSNGKPVGGATIKAYKDGTLVKSATTAEDGTYTLSDLSKGSYTIKMIVPSGYQACSSTSVCKTIECGDTDVVDFCLCQACAPAKICGKVSCNSTGKSMSKVTVKLYKGTTLIASDVTDYYGKYSFEGLSKATYTVKVIKPYGTSACSNTAVCVTPSCGQTSTVNFCLCKCW